MGLEIRAVLCEITSRNDNVAGAVRIRINGDIHLNENGHRLIAEEFTKEYN